MAYTALPTGPQLRPEAVLREGLEKALGGYKFIGAAPPAWVSEGEERPWVAQPHSLLGLLCFSLAVWVGTILRDLGVAP